MRELDQVFLYKINALLGEGKKFSRDHEAERYPSFVVLEADGNVIGKWSGYEKNHFIKSLKDVLGRRSLSLTEGKP